MCCTNQCGCSNGCRSYEYTCRVLCTPCSTLIYFNDCEGVSTNCAKAVMVNEGKSF